ncbi:unnamed protein product [Lactuca saligna]|uniref:Uncharacterized protein n=1 Tax=Lactuca saligna TaxID=75948 RepID=A0AA36E9Z5_LACSI|nr:unnamed protein product [Lactuca saligna]
MLWEPVGMADPPMLYLRSFEGILNGAVASPTVSPTRVYTNRGRGRRNRRVLRFPTRLEEDTEAQKFMKKKRLQTLITSFYPSTASTFYIPSTVHPSLSPFQPSTYLILFLSTSFCILIRAPLDLLDLYHQHTALSSPEKLINDEMKYLDKEDREETRRKLVAMAFVIVGEKQ